MKKEKKEQIEQIEPIEPVKKGLLSGINRPLLFSYIILFIASLVCKITYEPKPINVSENIGVTKAMFYSLSLVSLNWLPIFSIIGVGLTVLFRDNGLMKWYMILIFVVSSVLLIGFII